jgi:hypothetical protein
VLLILQKFYMPTQNDKSKKTTSGTEKKGTGKNVSKSGKGITSATMPAIPNARAKAKAMDNKRRGDTDTFNI